MSGKHRPLLDEDNEKSTSVALTWAAGAVTLPFHACLCLSSEQVEQALGKAKGVLDALSNGDVFKMSLESPAEPGAGDGDPGGVADADGKLFHYFCLVVSSN